MKLSYMIRSRFVFPGQFTHSYIHTERTDLFLFTQYNWKEDMGQNVYVFMYFLYRRTTVYCIQYIYTLMFYINIRMSYII